MTLSEQLNALKPYAPALSWSPVIQKWYVILWDWDEATFYGDTPEVAVNKAYRAMRKHLTA